MLGSHIIKPNIMFNEVFTMDKIHKKAVKIIIDDMKKMTEEQIDELLFFEQNLTKHSIQ